MLMTRLVKVIVLGLTIMACTVFHVNTAADLNYLETTNKRVWVDLSEQEIDDWYSPLEICMLKLSDREMSSPKAAYETCQYQGLRNPGHNKGCVLGKGSNKFPCYPPYTSRKSFTRGLKGYTDSSQKPLLELLKKLQQHNYTLVLLGDSTMRQKLNALDCELKREDNKAWIEGDLRGILPCHSSHKTHFDDADVGHVSVDIHAISVGPVSINCLEGGLHKHDPDGGGFYENARDIIYKLNHEEKKNVMLIANMGLWFNDEVKFQFALTGMMNWLANVSDTTVGGQVHNMVRWHETMSQHWPNNVGSGYYFKPMEYGVVFADRTYNETLETVSAEEWQVPGCCVPITNTSRGCDWRNEYAEDELKRVQSGRSGHDAEKFGIGRGLGIEVLSFKDVTDPVADMHVCSPLFKSDCTHYCYWPLMWQPFWHDLRDHAYRLDNMIRVQVQVEASV